jgi:hypothetical protein
LQTPPLYTLGFPNVEVSQAFGDLFLGSFTESFDPYSDSIVTKLAPALDKGEPEKLEECLRGLYASIPYQLHEGAERFYHAVFLATMQFLGFRVTGEISTSEGRMDGVIERMNGNTYVIEFKYAKAAEGADDAAVSALLDEGIDDAFSQIKKRGYADRYAGSDRRVFEVAVAAAGRGAVRVRARE